MTANRTMFTLARNETKSPAYPAVSLHPWLAKLECILAWERLHPCFLETYWKRTLLAWRPTLAMKKVHTKAATVPSRRTKANDSLAFETQDAHLLLGAACSGDSGAFEWETVSLTTSETCRLARGRVSGRPSANMRVSNSSPTATTSGCHVPLDINMDAKGGTTRSAT